MRVKEKNEREKEKKRKKKSLDVHKSMKRTTTYNKNTRQRFPL